MESVKAPLSTSTHVEMFKFFADLESCGNDIYDGNYLAASSELDPYQMPFGYDLASAYQPLFSHDDTDKGGNLPLTEDFYTGDSLPTTPDMDLFFPCVGSLMSPGSNFSDASTDTSLSSPLQLNECFNVFDFDFSASLPNEFFPSSEPPSRQPSPFPLSPTRKPPPHSAMSHPPQNLELMSQRSQEEHPSSSDSDHKRRFPCLILGCARRFTSQYTLKVHMEAHKPKPRVSFPCTHGCSERFSRQHDRLRHEVAKHGRVCEFLCDDCGRFFSSKKTLGNHKCPLAQGGTRWVI